MALFEVGSKIIADLKKEVICYDPKDNLEVVFRRDFPLGYGRVVGKNSKE